MEILEVIEECKIFDDTKMTKYRYLKEISKTWPANVAQQESSQFTTSENLVWEMKFNRKVVGKWGVPECTLSLALVSGDVSNVEVHIQCFAISKIFGLEGSLCALLDVKFDTRDFSGKSVSFFNPNLTAILANVQVIKRNTTGNVQNGQSKLLADLELMSNNKRLYDVTLVVGEKEYKAHKAILASRSPMFLNMFKPDMLEKVEERIEIKDVDPEIFNKLLEFIYTGKVNGVEKNAADLYVLSEKYSMTDLKRICNNIICNDLRVENIIGILILADSEKSVDLKIKAINFVVEHLEQIIDTEGYKTMVKWHPNLMDEIFRAIASKRTKDLQENQTRNGRSFGNVFGSNG